MQYETKTPMEDVEFPDFVLDSAFEGRFEIIHAQQRDLPNSVRVGIDEFDEYVVTFYPSEMVFPIDSVDVRKLLAEELDMKKAWNRLLAWVESHKKYKDYRYRYEDKVLYLFDEKNFIKNGG